MYIEEYWYGFIVVSDDGTALSEAFATNEEAIEYLERLERAQSHTEAFLDLMESA